MFILGGPSELMPEEGLSKTQRRQLAALEVGHSFALCKNLHCQRTAPAAVARTLAVQTAGGHHPGCGQSGSQRFRMQAKEKRKTREEEVAKAQMAAALNRGISWGMDEDAIMDDDDDDGVPSVEWRAYAQTHTLTDNQQKLADKLRRLENRIRNLTTEADRIKVRASSRRPSAPTVVLSCKASCVFVALGNTTLHCIQGVSLSLHQPFLCKTRSAHDE